MKAGPLKSQMALDSKQAGFSTIELMMAIVVLAIAVIGVSMVPALSLGRSTDSKTYALNVAREVLDSYRGQWQDHGAFTNADQPGVPVNLRFGCIVPAPVLEAYKFDASDNLQVSSTDVLMRKVTVEVKCSKGLDVKLSTYVGDPQPKPVAAP